MKSQAKITAFGTYVPERRLTNEDLQKMVDTSDEWIVQRTGMKERRIAAENESTSTLAIKAVEDLVKRSSLYLEDVDCIIVATTTAEYALPSVACRVQEYFNIPHTAAFDLSAACAGFTYGLHVANGLVSSGAHQKVLVIGAEAMSKVIDYEDRATCILFGDGAGAMVVEREEENPGFFGSHLETEGAGGIHLYRTIIGETMNGVELQSNGKMVQNGREVYKWAVRSVPKGIEQLLLKAGMNKTDVDWFVPHSANLRIIESICERSGLSLERSLTSVEYMGNTSSASIPLALDNGIKEGKVENGDLLLLYGFGGGLTQCGVLVRWDL
ncbi:ketoacyl-ACP synthase III [Priestia abyssalis]|uniref:ketoacyl-ACP synthase III n=1 Tax=Priestia abyssalis TaxID=1221450 RepID=UPI00099596A4|nr:ketoacyl-ACP synthase III [Priestia abyssalis]